MFKFHTNKYFFIKAVEKCIPHTLLSGGKIRKQIAENHNWFRQHTGDWGSTAVSKVQDC